MEESIRYAKKFLEDLLSFFGLNTDVRASCEEDVIELDVPSSHLNGFLIGQHGDTLRAMQYLVSSALKSQEHEIVRVSVDVADYKRHRRERLSRRVEDWIEEVVTSGEAKVLQPMNAADRRVVHRTVNEAAGVESESQGEGRDRHTIIKPANTEEVENTEATEEAPKD